MADKPSRFIRPLSRKERKEIDRLCRKRSKGVSLRAQTIQLSAQKIPIPDIVRRTGLSRQTVYFWMSRFEDYGLEGLEDQPRSGRPPHFTPPVCQKIVRIATSKPKDLGLHFTTWSLPKLKTYLIQTGLVPSICIESIRTALRKGGLTLKVAAKWMISRDPRFTSKKTR